MNCLWCHWCAVHLWKKQSHLLVTGWWPYVKNFIFVWSLFATFFCWLVCFWFLIRFYFVAFCFDLSKFVSFNLIIFFLFNLIDLIDWLEKNCNFFRELNRNFPPILLDFPPFLYKFLYFRGKISLQMSKFPGNHVPEFPFFQACKFHASWVK